MSDPRDPFLPRVSHGDGPADDPRRPYVFIGVDAEGRYHYYNTHNESVWVIIHKDRTEGVSERGWCFDISNLPVEDYIKKFAEEEVKWKELYHSPHKVKKSGVSHVGVETAKRIKQS